jgi:hypothetical protein
VVGAGGSSGGCSGVARVTTTTTTAATILAAIAAAITTIAAVVVVVLAIVVVGWTGRCGILWLRIWRRSASVERHRSNGSPGGVQVNLFQKEVIPNFKEVQER